MADDAYDGATKSWLESGESATCSFTLGYVEDAENYEIALADMGITDVGYISFDLAVSNPDSDSWNDYLFIKPVHIKTSIYESYTQNPPDYEGKLIFDENGIRIYSWLSTWRHCAAITTQIWVSRFLYRKTIRVKPFGRKYSIARISVKAPSNGCTARAGVRMIIYSGEAALRVLNWYYLISMIIRVSTAIEGAECSFVFQSGLILTRRRYVLGETPTYMNFN
jgi:hypothetical protein